MKISKNSINQWKRNKGNERKEKKKFTFESFIYKSFFKFYPKMTIKDQMWKKLF